MEAASSLHHVAANVDVEHENHGSFRRGVPPPALVALPLDSVVNASSEVGRVDFFRFLRDDSAAYHHSRHLVVRW